MHLSTLLFLIFFLFPSLPWAESGRQRFLSGCWVPPLSCSLVPCLLPPWPLPYWQCFSYLIMAPSRVPASLVLKISSISLLCSGVKLFFQSPTSPAGTKNMMCLNFSYHVFLHLHVSTWGGRCSGFLPTISLFCLTAGDRDLALVGWTINKYLGITRHKLNNFWLDTFAAYYLCFYHPVLCPVWCIILKNLNTFIFLFLQSLKRFSSHWDADQTTAERGPSGCGCCAVEHLLTAPSANRWALPSDAAPCHAGAVHLFRDIIQHVRVSILLNFLNWQQCDCSSSSAVK